VTGQSTGELLTQAAGSAGVRDRRVLEAMGAVRREGFVPAEYADAAGRDEPIPIPYGQVTTQPSLSARMIEALRLNPGDRVLEIGTGYGYQTALLARLASFIISVERHRALADQARANFAEQQVTNVRVFVGDGTEGIEAYAPYDAVLVSAAFPQVPVPLVEQLRSGGRLVQPIGSGGEDMVTLFERQPHGLIELARVVPARFVRLYGSYAYPRTD